MSFADKIKAMAGLRAKPAQPLEPTVSGAPVITGDDVLRIAKAVARRYANRCWWADVDDMTSEASVAVLQAARTFDPEVGIPFDGYAARAAALRVKMFLWGESSPVSGGLHDPQKHIAGVMRDELTVRGRGDDKGAEFERPELSYSPDPGDELDAVDWRLKVRRRVRALSRDGRDGDLAHEVLVRGRRPAELIEETGRDVYGAVHLVRRKLREDRRAYELWRQNGGRGGGH